MIKGGQRSIFLLWTATFPSLSHLSPTPGKLQSIQSLPPSCLLFLQTPDTSARAGARKKPRTPAICMLWSARQSRRPLTPRPPTTSSLPLAPVEVPRRPQHATALAPSFPSLSYPCRACPEPPEPANARASSWLHPELAPLHLSFSLGLDHDHKRPRHAPKCPYGLWRRPRPWP